MAGNANPNPQEQVVEDLIKVIATWRSQNKAVLVCMDANDDICNLHPEKGIGCIMTEMIKLNYTSSNGPILFAHQCTIEDH